ncbi:hypothetical protein AB0M02_28575 [Actinoplanes sp. NPDC051861]|uniref:hypothetical protein n=1 Tax=Actinoplanes sp. NPDC051861 TaxID=3155170 RepID=UPI0034404C74
MVSEAKKPQRQRQCRDDTAVTENSQIMEVVKHEGQLGANRVVAYLNGQRPDGPR